MREIDLTSAQDFDKLPSHTFLLYGPSRTGKTTFIAGFPRPLEAGIFPAARHGRSPGQPD
jgi:predicted AAA+ superfamily ATPase